jgi:hypothetical protein
MERTEIAGTGVAAAWIALGAWAIGGRMQGACDIESAVRTIAAARR